jgi:hypothetical protein
VPETHLFGYTDKLQAGKLLVVVHGTAEEVEKAEAALAHSHAEEIHRHAEEDA